MIDLGAKVDVNAIRIAWADPYAKRYYVQFWTGEQAPFYNGINKGAWQTFPMGAIADGKGGTPTLKLMSPILPVRYLRIWMTESSNTCDTHGAQDKRNCVGYAINELYVGTVSADGQFKDIVKHLPSRQQTITWPSSVDPWHAASDLDYGRGDQIGLDFFLHLRRDARAARDDPCGAAVHDPGGCGQRDRVRLQAQVSRLVDRDG